MPAEPYEKIVKRFVSELGAELNYLGHGTYDLEHFYEGGELRDGLDSITIIFGSLQDRDQFQAKRYLRMSAIGPTKRGSSTSLLMRSLSEDGRPALLL
jgi:hypothetical protein